MDLYQNIKNISCGWCGYFFPRTSSTSAYCTGECKNEARKERARSKRDIANIMDAFKKKVLTEEEKNAKITRAQYMPQCMHLDLQRETKEEHSRKFRTIIHQKYVIIKAVIMIWIDQKKGNHHGSIGNNSSTTE